MTVDQLKAQRKSKKSSFNSYANRRNAVKTIISNIDNKLGDDIGDVNGQISSCISELRQGLKGSSKLETVCSAMEAVKEGSSWNDSKISSCRSNLSNEVNRCQRNINSLDAEIKNIENQIKAQGGTVYFWE